jgi:hypothetical protein
MARGVRTGILCYMARLRDRWFTPGEIAKSLTYRKSGIQIILEKFKDERLVERRTPPTASLPPSIASLPPTYPVGVTKLVSRQTNRRQLEKPYRILPDGERMCSLMKTIEQIGLPAGLQKTALAGDSTFMGKLRAAGFDENDIERAEKIGILNHQRRRVKIVEEQHDTTFGVITQASIANALQPQVRTVQTETRHHYKIA